MLESYAAKNFPSAFVPLCLLVRCQSAKACCVPLHRSSALKQFYQAKTNAGFYLELQFLFMTCDLSANQINNAVSWQSNGLNAYHISSISGSVLVGDSCLMSRPSLSSRFLSVFVFSAIKERRNTKNNLHILFQNTKELCPTHKHPPLPLDSCKLMASSTKMLSA